MTKYKIVLATRPASELCLNSLRILAISRGERSAERRIQPMSAPHNQMSPPDCARGAEARQKSGRARLPALHLRHSPRLLPLGSAPGRASWNYRVQTGGPSPAPVQRAPRRPVVVPAGTMPEASRVRIGNSARGDRSRSTLQACLPERRPSIERDTLYVTKQGTFVNRLVTPLNRHGRA